jgi:hypothetical protein
MTMLMLFAPQGAPPPQPPSPEGVGYYLPQRNIPRDKPVVPRPGIAPGVRFRARALLLTSGAAGAAATRGAALTAPSAFHGSFARGAGRAPGAARACAARLHAGPARVDVRLSLDEMAALLVAAL